MCEEHAEQALQVIDDRLELAPVTNPDDWDAIVGASSMLSEPTFGLSLLADPGRAADSDRDGPPSPDELRGDADLALELARRQAAAPGEPG